MNVTGRPTDDLLAVVRAVAIVVLLGGVAACAPSSATPEPPAAPGAMIGPAERTRVGRIPASAAIVFTRDGMVYVAGADGTGETQITFEKKNWEHVALAPGRRYLAGNEQVRGPDGGVSRIWLYDLEAGTVGRLLPQFITAGNGGIDWDRSGFLYFSGKDRDPIPGPRTREEHIANAAANDVWKVRFDGTGLTRITNTLTRGEADVSVSEDGTLVAFMDLLIDPPNDRTEVWVVRADGSDPRRVVLGGAPGIASVHDPELSPDNRRVVYSQVNSAVPPNFPKDSAANTAHDIWSVAIDGTDPVRLTRPGPISIVPDWVGDRLLYLELSDRDGYLGLAIIAPTGTEQAPRRILRGAAVGKWIP